MVGKRVRKKKKEEEEIEGSAERGREQRRNDHDNNNDDNESCAQVRAGNDETAEQGGRARRPGMTAVEGVAEGHELMEGWSENQLELFHALVRVVSKVGDEGAAEIQRPARRLDGVAFVGEIAALRARARKADEYEGERAVEEENKKEKKTRLVTTAMASIDVDSVAGPQDGSERLLTEDIFNKALGEYLEEKRAGLRSSGVQTDSIVGGDDSYTTLTNKYNVLKQNNRELSFARQALENRLREKTRNEKGWVDYARALEKQKGNLVALLNSHDISTEGLLNSLDPPKAPSTIASISPRISPSTSMGVEMEPTNDNQYKVSSGMLGTPRGNDNVLLQGLTSSRESHNHLRVLRSEEQFGEQSRDNSDMSLLNKLWGHLDANNGETDAATITASKEMHETGKPETLSGDPQALQLHHSSSTQANLDGNSMVGQVEQGPVAPILVKLESPSDTPVVIASRSVKKRKRRSERELEDSIKIKVEVISSSPVGLAGFQQLFPQENMDLDDIGMKVNTPKKKRQLAAPSSHISRYTGQFNSTPKGMASILQPLSPNKQILPRTSDKEQQRKQQRLGEDAREARIFAEDDSNESTNWDSSSTKNPNEKYRFRSSADKSEAERRLTGLLEEPSPQKTPLTPKTTLDASATSGHPISGFMSWQQPLPVAEQRTISILRQPGVPATPNQQHLSRDTASDNSKALSRRKPALRTPRDVTKFDPDSPAHMSLRKRKVCDLGLSHFKVNPNFNQGYDYAFADVVRGREQRKCLPGCTKPECCGDKFRKFVEMMSRGDEQQTESQEQHDEKLLEEFLGDNRHKLRMMSKAERSELLIQAKTRDLARKAGKHRQAYERRRSPPGFWRTDFPSTQELESDRIEAARVEMELVQQRYDEAMRPGGKWIFRDE